jgi:uncharacterized SAM-binding protein YcdF (DUF218 family)
LVLALVTIAALWRFPNFSRVFLGLCLVGLYVFSTPLVSSAMLRSLEQPSQPITNAQAIVVLGAGIVLLPDGSSEPDRLSLERLVGAARAARLRANPVLVAGGRFDERPAIASVLARSLQRDFGIEARWVEDRSHTTGENAVEAWKILNAGGVSRIVLVTHAWHIPRARLVFERLGFEVTAAGVGQVEERPFNVYSLMPSAEAALESYYAWHEIIGLRWYEIAFRPSDVGE